MRYTQTRPDGSKVTAEISGNKLVLTIEPSCPMTEAQLSGGAKRAADAFFGSVGALLTRNDPSSPISDEEFKKIGDSPI